MGKCGTYAYKLLLYVRINKINISKYEQKYNEHEICFSVTEKKIFILNLDLK
jgi:hypothetical protein